MKQRIRLNESQLRQVIKESISKVLNEAEAYRELQDTNYFDVEEKLQNGESVVIPIAKQNNSYATEILKQQFDRIDKWAKQNGIILHAGNMETDEIGTVRQVFYPEFRR